jgi:hypothetical protein
MRGYIPFVLREKRQQNNHKLKRTREQAFNITDYHVSSTRLISAVLRMSALPPYNAAGCHPVSTLAYSRSFQLVRWTDHGEDTSAPFDDSYPGRRHHLGACHGMLHASGIRHLSNIKALINLQIADVELDYDDRRNLLRVIDDLLMMPHVYWLNTSC